MANRTLNCGFGMNFTNVCSKLSKLLYNVGIFFISKLTGELQQHLSEFGGFCRFCWFVLLGIFMVKVNVQGFSLRGLYKEKKGGIEWNAGIRKCHNGVFCVHYFKQYFLLFLTSMEKSWIFLRYFLYLILKMKNGRLVQHFSSNTDISVLAFFVSNIYNFFNWQHLTISELIILNESNWNLIKVFLGFVEVL